MQSEAFKRTNAEDLYREVKKKWASIYPAYFDSTKSLSEGSHQCDAGRRLNKNLCVEHPNPEEIVRALNTLMIRSIFESDKAYPKDWLTRGRWKVELKDNNNVPIYANINTSTIRLM